MIANDPQREERRRIAAEVAQSVFAHPERDRVMAHLLRLEANELFWWCFDHPETVVRAPAE